VNTPILIASQIQIVIVDDVQTIRSMVKTHLSTMGILSTFEFEDGSTAWKFLLQQQNEEAKLADLNIAD
jgi:CheY-like chemotaxis protein